MKLSKYDNEKTGWNDYQKDITAFMTSTDTNGDKGDRTILSIDLMDMWVAVNHPETIDKWVEECSKFEDIPLNGKNENGETVQKKAKDGTPITRKDRKSIMKYFLETYDEFKEYTDEAREERKNKKTSKWEEKQRENERIRAMTPEERFKEKMERLSRLRKEETTAENKPETEE